MSNIVGSRYVKRLYNEAKALQDQLNFYSDILEEWKEYQRNWLYLDAILSAGEIRKSIKELINEYETNNKAWHKFMKDVNKKPNVRSCLQTHRL